MRKVVHTLVLVAAIAGLMVATSSHNNAPAQVKPKPAVPAAAAQEDVGTIEVYTDKAGKWRFRVKLDGKSIAIGTVGYAKKADTLKVVATLKATMAKRKVVEIEPDDKK